MNFLLITSSIIIFIKHPISLGFTILIHTILTCLIIGLIRINYWFSYILILIIIGGLLVLFIYITRIASNEKFKFNNIILLIIIIIIIIRFIILQKRSIFIININLNNELLENFNYNEKFKINITKFLNFPNSNLFLLIIFYLLVTIIAIVKITKLNFGPLRQLKYENTFTKT